MNVSAPSIVTATVIKVFTEIFQLLLPVFFLFILVAVIRFLYLRHKYHYNDFDVFKKRIVSKDIKKDIVYIMIEKLEGHFNVIKVDNLNSDLVVLDETGIYLIKMILNYEGIVRLDKEKNILYNCVTSRKCVKIGNPFSELDSDIKKLKGMKCHGVVVFDSNIILELKYNGPHRITRISNIVYFIKSQMTDSKKVYKTSELDKIAEEIRGR